MDARLCSIIAALLSGPVRPGHLDTPGQALAVYTLGDRRVAIEGAEWYIAENAAVIGSVVVSETRRQRLVSASPSARQRVDHARRALHIQDGSVLHAIPAPRSRSGRNVSVGHHVMLHGVRSVKAALVGTTASS